MQSHKIGNIRLVSKDRKIKVYCDECKEECKELSTSPDGNFGLYGCPKCRKVYYVTVLDFLCFSVSSTIKGCG